MEENRLTEQFLSLFEDNVGMIIKISRAYAKTTQDREDLINDIAIELWKSLRRFNGASKVSTWVYRVVLNTSMNYRRKKISDKAIVSNYIDQANFQSIVDKQESSPYSNILYECIDQLTDINKAIILLYLDGNSHQDISDITGVSKTNVGTRISRIKEQLKVLVSKIE